ncbi:hypothetical protein MTBBW1_600078 [Desulfamplus magnetovallimortis]|uniref:Uncharacterized protein n=1 Tax=Desulfamplus magnetovallimortis TaxID=1246637 RepID=A0A1W1HIP9_9BACT|nr:hypothetical protein [Desulfamplus magnetovallimortis]SLM32248.1 hypothetical protein MTBBW1_600078 [Desulfamplus magnetovallimortis]
MQVEKIKKYVRGQDLPITWQKEMNIQPQKFFTVILKEINVNDCDIDIDGSLMPPENEISENLIKAVAASEESLKKGDFVDCSSDAERDALFDSIWSDGSE